MGLEQDVISATTNEWQEFHFNPKPSIRMLQLADFQPTEAKRSVSHNTFNAILNLLIQLLELFDVPIGRLPIAAAVNLQQSSNDLTEAVGVQFLSLIHI